MKQTLQSRFLHCVAPNLSSGILPTTDYGTTIKSLHTKAVSDSKYLLSHNSVLQTASLHIAPEEANLPREVILGIIIHSAKIAATYPDKAVVSCGLVPHPQAHLPQRGPGRGFRGAQGKAFLQAQAGFVVQGQHRATRGCDLRFGNVRILVI